VDEADVDADAPARAPRTAVGEDAADARSARDPGTSPEARRPEPTARP
jgi:hypothetical protein